MVWLHPSDWYCVALIIDGNNTQCSRDAHIYADIKYKRSETNGITWTDSIASAPARLLVAGVRPDPDRGNWCDSWWEINAVNQTAWPPHDLRISHCNIAYLSSYPGYISLWCCYVLDFLRVSGVSYNCNNTLSPINALRPKQNGRHFEDTFSCIFLDENVWNAIKISLNFVPFGPIENSSALVLIMAWCRRGDKPLSEPMTA